MRAIKQSFKYGITTALLVILVGGVQACTDISPMEPGTPQNAAPQFTSGDSATLGDREGCILINGQWECND